MGCSIVYTLHAVYTSGGLGCVVRVTASAVTGGRCSGPRPLKVKRGREFSGC